MAEPILYSVTDGVAVIGIDHPPVNALSWPVRDGLLTALARAEADPEAQAILVTGEGRTFPAGADIAEFDKPPRDPWVPELCNRLELCEKPVVAELHGMVLGGGLELALGCHYRIARRSTRVGFPEVKLGLIPGAGGTQRAPRMVGVKVALDMILSGRLFPIDRAPFTAFADKLVAEDADLRAAALEFCRAAVALGPRPTRDRREGFADPAETQAELRRRAEAVADAPEIAPREAVAAVEAAFLLPFEAGCTFEEAAFAELVTSDQSKALRHAFFAERSAAKVPLPEGVTLPEIRSLAILGGGPLAGQLAFAALDAGMSVRWGTQDEDLRSAGQAEVERTLDNAVDAGALSPEAATERLQRLTCGTGEEMVAGSDFVLQAAKGQFGIQTAGLPRASALADRVEEIGLRFARPAHLSRLVEVIEGPRARPEQLAAALALVKAMGKLPVHVRSHGDSIGGRMMGALHRAADALVDMGASPYEIDTALSDWGFALPPFLQRDASGLAGKGTVERPAGGRDWSAFLAQTGRTGRDRGRGFYTYSGEEGMPSPDRAVLAMIDSARGKAPGLSRDRIVPLILGAMVNEGTRLVDQDIAARASDIDVVMMLAHQFPRWRGGPMKGAELHGLFRLIRAMEGLGHPDRPFWTPHLRLVALVRNGQGVEALTGAA